MASNSTINERLSGSNTLEKIFITRVLKDTAKDIISSQDKAFSRLRNVENIAQIRSARKIKVSGVKLQFTHSIRQRFIDMKRIRGQHQKSGLVHNKVLFPSLMGSMVAELAFGFTEQVKKELSIEHNIQL